MNITPSMCGAFITWNQVKFLSQKQHSYLKSMAQHTRCMGKHNDCNIPLLLPLNSSISARSKHWHTGRMRPADSFCAARERFLYTAYHTKSYFVNILYLQPLLYFCFGEEGSLRMCCCTDPLAVHTALASHTSLKCRSICNYYGVTISFCNLRRYIS